MDPINKNNISILGGMVVQKIAENSVIMPTGIIASLMLIKNESFLSELVESFNDIRKDLIERKIEIVMFGYIVGIS